MNSLQNRVRAVRSNLFERVGQISRNRILHFFAAQQRNDGFSDLRFETFELVGRDFSDNFGQRARKRFINRFVYKISGFLFEKLAAQRFFDSFRQIFIDQIINFLELSYRARRKSF
jgi:hypothetical protein